MDTKSAIITDLGAVAFELITRNGALNKRQLDNLYSFELFCQFSNYLFTKNTNV